MHYGGMLYDKGVCVVPLASIQRRTTLYSTFEVRDGRREWARLPQGSGLSLSKQIFRWMGCNSAVEQAVRLFNAFRRSVMLSPSGHAVDLVTRLFVSRRRP